MRAYYTLLKELEDVLNSDYRINNVTFGDLEEVDLNKTSLYPLAHFGINSSTIENNLISFSVSLLCMDITSKKEGYEEEGNIYRNNNTQYILNEMLGVLNTTLKTFKLGVSSREGYKLDNDTVEAEPFKDRFNDSVAGWITTFTIKIPLNDLFCSPLLIPINYEFDKEKATATIYFNRDIDLDNTASNWRLSFYEDDKTTIIAESDIKLTSVTTTVNGNILEIDFTNDLTTTEINTIDSLNHYLVINDDFIKDNFRDTSLDFLGDFIKNLYRVGSGEPI